MSIKFIIGPKNYKYTAIIKDKKVNFGDKRYEHYHDKIGLYSHLDHNDKKRRASYRKRHSAILTKDGKKAISIKYSPAWFSYKYLW
jgi:hypothetical protein